MMKVMKKKEKKENCKDKKKKNLHQTLYVQQANLLCNLLMYTNQLLMKNNKLRNSFKYN